MKILMLVTLVTLTLSACPEQDKHGPRQNDPHGEVTSTR